MNKTFLCLANSRKISGRCIAGREVLPGAIGGWIRPVSGRQTHEISEDERRYQNGLMPRVGEVIQVVTKGALVHPAQEENHLIDDQYYWHKVEDFRGDLASLVETPPSLWGIGNSSYNGRNDRVAVSTVTAPIQSLYFIRPEELKITVAVEGAEFGNAKKRVRAGFRYNGADYYLAVTDPEAERRYLAQGVGTYPFANARGVYLTVSLGDAYQGDYYKLVAAVIEG